MSDTVYPPASTALQCLLGSKTLSSMVAHSMYTNNSASLAATTVHGWLCSRCAGQARSDMRASLRVPSQLSLDSCKTDISITFVFWIFPFKPDVIYCLLPPSDLLPVRSPLGKTVPFFHDQDKVTTYSHLGTQEGMLNCESFGVKNLWLIFHLGHFYPPKCRGTLQALSLISDGICEQLIFL